MNYEFRILNSEFPMCLKFAITCTVFVIFGTMKLLTLCLSLLSTGLFAQKQTVFAYMDYNNFFRSFKDGYFNQVDHQAVTGIAYGDEIIAYYNNQRDFKIYDGKFSRVMTNQPATFKISDHLAAWNIGQLLYYYEDGKPHNLTSFGGEYWVSDSLITYQDLRYNTLNVVYKGKISTLMQSTTDLPVPVVQGDNLLVFVDNGGIYKVFHKGQTYDLGTYNGTPFEFFAGTDVLGFNDPQTRTFAVFQDGEFLDVEEFHAPKVKAGRGFLAYEDLQGNLKYYSKGKYETLSSFAQFWDAKDDLVVWGDANTTYQYFKNEKKSLANFVIKEWQMKNDVVAFRTLMGGIGASIGGVYKEVTSINGTEFIINGHGVMVQLQNRAVLVLYNGQVFRD